VQEIAELPTETIPAALFGVSLRLAVPSRREPVGYVDIVWSLSAVDKTTEHNQARNPVSPVIIGVDPFGSFHQFRNPARVKHFETPGMGIY
jgi:hypothetical protein